MVKSSNNSKQARRKRLASLSFSEKVKILAKLRDRSKAIAASRRRLAQAAEKAARQ